MNQFPESLVDELRSVFKDRRVPVYRAPGSHEDPFPGHLPLKSIEFRPGSARSIIDVVIGDDIQPPVKVVISAGNFKDNYSVPNSSRLSNLAWVISIHAEEQVFSYSRSELPDVVELA